MAQATKATTETAEENQRQRIQTRCPPSEAEDTVSGLRLEGKRYSGMVCICLCLPVCLCLQMSVGVSSCLCVSCLSVGVSSCLCRVCACLVCICLCLPCSSNVCGCLVVSVCVLSVCGLWVSLRVCVLSPRMSFFVGNDLAPCCQSPQRRAKRLQRPNASRQASVEGDHQEVLEGPGSPLMPPRMPWTRST